MKLNLGCGTDKKEGYINLDIREEVRPDIVADVKKLPFKVKAFKEIVCNDIIEHFSWRQSKEILTQIKKLLRKDGVLIIRCPDIRKIINDFDFLTLRRFNALLFGGQDYKHNYHFACFTKEYLQELLQMKLVKEEKTESKYNMKLYFRYE